MMHIRIIMMMSSRMIFKIHQIRYSIFRKTRTEEGSIDRLDRSFNERTSLLIILKHCLSVVLIVDYSRREIWLERMERQRDLWRYHEFSLRILY